MLFSSISFLYLFLPLVLLVYFVVPKSCKNLVLLVFSLLFYFIGEPRYLLVMVGSTASAYFFGLWIGRSKNKKAPMVLSVSVSLVLLLFFKYTDFFIGNINGLFSADIALLRLSLPIGISFYTFQAMSYTIDLYRGQVDVQRSFINFAAYISLFPQLIAGPIVRYSVIEEQLNSREHSAAGFSAGITRFATGLGKKVLIANVLGELAAKLGASPEPSVLFYWICAVAYPLQIYFDFSGYSDMAIGLGKIFGFDFQENFNYPFISKSISEFWRRWHISLGSWFRDYVYIPLGGSRVSTMKWLRNIAIVWFLTGFWHGASWNFIIWGLYFAVFLLLERLFILKLLSKLPGVFSHIYVIFVIIISFVLFASADMNAFAGTVSGLFGAAPPAGEDALYYLRSYGVVITAACIGATPLIKKLLGLLAQKRGGETVIIIMRPVYVGAVLILVTAFLIDGSFNPFLYFRF